jgi:hypothetical protein
MQTCPITTGAAFLVLRACTCCCVRVVAAGKRGRRPAGERLASGSATQRGERPWRLLGGLGSQGQCRKTTKTFFVICDVTSDAGIVLFRSVLRWLAPSSTMPSLFLSSRRLWRVTRALSCRPTSTAPRMCALMHFSELHARRFCSYRKDMIHVVSTLVRSQGTSSSTPGGQIGFIPPEIALPCLFFTPLPKVFD